MRRQPKKSLAMKRRIGRKFGSVAWSDHFLVGQRKKELEKMNMLGDFPGGPMVKTPRFRCRRHMFDPWSWN